MVAEKLTVVNALTVLEHPTPQQVADYNAVMDIMLEHYGLIPVRKEDELKANEKAATGERKGKSRPVASALNDGKPVSHMSEEGKFEITDVV